MVPAAALAPRVSPNFAGGGGREAGQLLGVQEMGVLHFHDEGSLLPAADERLRLLVQNCNADVLKSARARNLEMLESCCKCGAWMDHADATDEEGDTALHIIIKGCWNYKEYLAEADRLGLQVSWQPTSRQIICGRVRWT